ncbi:MULTISPECIES: PKD-like family lipoprotein [Sphingobacterium]|uniref:PKD-like family lipoprotein n=1 Tax=Sphingobacterium TaxID=28453 RepID=UPI0013DCD863|nr:MULTISPECIES: PKD-like family lipoprotein [unclassified Sphingobacterium]
MIRIYMLSVLVLLFSSCLKDKTNTDFLPHEVITVEGIESSYTKVSEIDRIILDPQVTSTDPNAEFEFMWGIYNSNIAGLDTLSKSKNLDYLVRKPANSWKLLFRVANKNTGYTKYVTSELSVITQFTRGWYVAKGDAGKTDVDLFFTPSTIVPESKMENVFNTVNGRSLDGNPLIMNFYNNYSVPLDGKRVLIRGLFVVSDKDATVVDINTLKEVRNFNQLFHSAPTKKLPGFVGLGMSAYYFLNDGGLHSVYSNGEFGVKKIRDNLNTPYRLSNYFLTSWVGGNPILYDEISSSFVSADGSGSYLTTIQDAAGTSMPANNNNKKLLFMGLKTFYSPFSGFAVLQDKTNPNLKIVSKITETAVGGRASTIRLENDTLKTTDKIFNATQYALLDGDENMIYFCTGNEIWSRNLSNGFEQLQYRIPAGEEVTFMRHRKYTREAPYNFNFIMVGTKVGGNYKVRMFTKTLGNLSSEPKVVLEGKGAVGDVIYISPSVTSTTYNNTY